MLKGFCGEGFAQVVFDEGVLEGAVFVFLAFGGGEHDEEEGIVVLAEVFSNFVELIEEFEAVNAGHVDV